MWSRMSALGRDCESGGSSFSESNVIYNLKDSKLEEKDSLSIGYRCIQKTKAESNHLHNFLKNFLKPRIAPFLAAAYFRLNPNRLLYC